MTDAPAILALVESRPPTLGEGRLLCVDGPAGSGKTTLANAVAELADAPVVRMDDLYPGWAGLFDVEPHVLGILGPLAEGRPGRYRRFDWVEGRYAEEHAVAPSPLLILEGVGSWHRSWAAWATALVWVEAPREVRLERGLDRDGEAFREQWATWMADEQLLFEREDTRASADLVIETGPA